jgi:hypothetical protein
MNIIFIVIIAVILILLFLILREFFCWYWKINKIVDLLEDIKQNTSKDLHTETGTKK